MTATNAPKSILTKSLEESLTSEKNRRYSIAMNVILFATEMINLAQKLSNFRFSTALPPPPNSDLCSFIHHAGLGYLSFTEARLAMSAVWSDVS